MFCFDIANFRPGNFKSYLAVLHSAPFSLLSVLGLSYGLFQLHLIASIFVIFMMCWATLMKFENQEYERNNNCTMILINHF